MEKVFEVRVKDDIVNESAIYESLTNHKVCIASEQITVKEITPNTILAKETAVLNVPKLPDGWSIYKPAYFSSVMLYNGANVDLTEFPELRPLCEVKTKIDWGSVKDGSLICAKFNNGDGICGYISTKKTINNCIFIRAVGSSLCLPYSISNIISIEEVAQCKQ